MKNRYNLKEQTKINNPKILEIMRMSNCILETDMKPLDISKPDDLIKATEQTMGEFCMLSCFCVSLSEMHQEFDRLLQLNRPDLWINEMIASNPKPLKIKMGDYEDSYVGTNRKLSGAFEEIQELLEEVREDLIYIFDEVINTNDITVKEHFFGKEYSLDSNDLLKKRVAEIIEYGVLNDKKNGILYRETYDKELNSFKELFKTLPREAFDSPLYIYYENNKHKL